MRLWIERSQLLSWSQIISGQPRMRLWIERLWFSPASLKVSRSASYEAVNWKCSNTAIRGYEDRGQPRMRLWIERSLVTLLTIVLWGQPRMRLWIERICLNANLVMRVGSASYEAVNWKISTIVDFVVQFLVSLVWGCELKDLTIRSLFALRRSASYEAVNWKFVRWLYTFILPLVSLVWGCELKE